MKGSASPGTADAGGTGALTWPGGRLAGFRRFLTGERWTFENPSSVRGAWLSTERSGLLKPAPQPTKPESKHLAAVPKAGREVEVGP